MEDEFGDVVSGSRGRNCSASICRVNTKHSVAGAGIVFSILGVWTDSHLIDILMLRRSVGDVFGSFNHPPQSLLDAGLVHHIPVCDDFS